MFKNYFKTAWRNLTKNKFYSLINIAGLSVGLCIGMIILLWVQDEYSFDNFHSNAKNIYRLENRVGTGNSTQIWTETVAPIGMLAKQQLPEVKNYVRLCENYFYSAYRNGDKVFNENNTIFTDPQFFTFFDFPIIKGNKTNPFPNSNSVVLTESYAKKYFGNDDPIGKTILADNKVSFMVSGVVKDFPLNSSIRPDMIFPMEYFRQQRYANSSGNQTMDHDFVQFNYETYLALQPGTNITALATKIRNIHLANKADDTDILYLPQALKNMHLYHADGTDGGIETVRIFTIIALLILAIGCINYVNLSTARSMLRAKEVSMRKIVGAAKMQLFLQFIIETALLFILASVIAVALMYLVLPVFNTISGKELVINPGDYHLWMVILLTITGTLIASSIYPAMLLSSFQPLKALRGKFSTSSGDAGFRKVLVVTQFVFSVVLITGTIVIRGQLDYIRSRQLGYDKSYTIHVGMGEMGNHFDAVKAELLKQPGVLAVTRASSSPVQIGGETGNNDWVGKQTGQTLMLHPMAIDKNFIPFFKMQLVQGNNFTGAVADSSHFILNEAAIRETGIKDPIGKTFKLWDNHGTIIGVVKDFHFASMREKIAPAIFFYNPNNEYQLFIKTTGRDAPKAIAAAEAQWKKYNAGFPFSYNFLDDTFNRMYRGEERTGLLFNVFAGIAIFISCLGLFGLAAYTAQVRTREIGVRKVLGASVTGIIRLLATDFVKLVLIAIVIATPVAWYAMNTWLQGFAYKINMGWAVFALAGIIAIAIAFITISFQAVKAALANPVKSLRTE
ncbi:MAG TPA: ABC transporter permease [Chitinophagaceae bacterium]|nr:ABC transporter permease [Chitinophagaceae bacterium]